MSNDDKSENKIMTDKTTQQAGGCPFSGAGAKKASDSGQANRDWWPSMLNVGILRQHSAESNPMGTEFNYAEAFQALDLESVKPVSYTHLTLPTIYSV